MPCHAHRSVSQSVFRSVKPSLAGTFRPRIFVDWQLHSCWSLANKNLYCTVCYPELAATSAARCLIISITAALRRESDCCCNLLKCSFRSLHRGTLHSDSLQARECIWSRYHIFLHRTQPPEARVLHCIPWRKRPLTLRQFGYWHWGDRHCDAWTKRSSIFLSCKTRFARASLFWASRSAIDGWLVNLWIWSIPPFW